MTHRISLAIVAAVLMSAACAQAQTPDPKGGDKGKVCRMEQQCHWENFKKICTYVKVCR